MKPIVQEAFMRCMFVNNYSMKNNIIKAFTLVELVVVITIVGILSTVGFVAYTDYLKGVRDGSRAQQMSSLFRSIELYSTKRKIPLSQSAILVSYSGAQIWHQWDIDQDILDKIRYSDGWFDPKTKLPYTYFVSQDRKSAQLLWYFEEQNSDFLTQTLDFSSYASYESYFPKVYGSELWILIDSSLKIPMHKIATGSIDLFQNSSNITALLTNNQSISTQSGDFYALIPNTSCSKLQSLLLNMASWIYKINPSAWEGLMEVYCEMDDSEKWHWAWWTLVARTHQWASPDMNFWWLYNTWDVYNDSVAYSLWANVKDIRFSEILIGKYETGKNITSALKFDVNNIFYVNQMKSPDATTKNITTNCTILYGLWWNIRNCGPFRYWGAFLHNKWYAFERYSSWNAHVVWPNKIESHSNSLPPVWSDSLQSTQWMIFVR